ncbi:MAG: hypothetical protein HC929_23320 [Leptolyngbyaceae cyanobacterium SM2_5_2]|nr:hypothetical protein [Leptolyngbyaceae cyanobacterium SM2_5_2]
MVLLGCAGDNPAYGDYYCIQAGGPFPPYDTSRVLAILKRLFQCHSSLRPDLKHEIWVGA